MPGVIADLIRVHADHAPEEIIAPGVLAAGARRYPDKPLLLQGNDLITYGEAARGVNRIATGLAARHVGPGTQVAIMGHNSFAWFMTWIAVLKVGAVAVPVNTGLKGVDLTYILTNSQAALIVCDPEFEAAVSRALADGGLSAEVVPDMNTLLDPGAAALEAPSAPTLGHDEPGQIMYTSGTTGPPKGVVIRRSQIGPAAGLLVGSMIGVDASDVLYTCFPLFHASGQASCLAAMWNGATVALARRFSASRFWEELVHYGATRFNYLGGIPRILMKTAPTPAESEHRVEFCFGAAMPSDLWLDFEKRFGVRALELYSQTEGGFLYNGPDGKVGSIGTPIPGFGEVAILDASGAQCGPDTVGELCFRPPDPAMLPRFWNSPEEQERRTDGGWLHTGDLARFDHDGFYYFEDRQKDGLRRRGENISSWSIETAISAHPSVLECAAYGVPSELGEDDVKVDVVLRPGAALDEPELVLWCGERLASFMVPRYVQFRDSLPKTETLRVQKHLLKREGVADAWDRDKHTYLTSLPMGHRPLFAGD
jgi:crotonobetaine/carnitine-CoA ligase